MSTANDRSTVLEDLLKSLPPAEASALPDADDPLVVLVQSFLVADATVEKARAAWERIRAAIVDLNDLRVTMASEMVEMIGPRYPEAEARCDRLRAALRSVYNREHEMSLASVAAAGKRDARKYLDTIEGITPYVAARTVLLGFGGHAIPVDARLLAQLREADVAEEREDEAEFSAWLTRQVKAADGLDVHHRLQAWSEAQPVRSATSPSAKTTTKKSSSKKTAKKSGATKTTAKKPSTTKKSSSKKSTGRKTTKKSSAGKAAASGS